MVADAEILLFGPEKHAEGPGVVARLARLAVVGECAELGGTVMLRVSWPRPSVGSLGDGTEDSLSRVRFPSGLHLDAEFELCTPDATLYADRAVHLTGKLSDLSGQGSELHSEGPGAALADRKGEAQARLTGVQLTLRETHIDETAPVNR
ncbi:DUF6004 family protein [Streptomyces sp. NPDC058486]|uniref:DUF6004 family protein n=1 Tax=unclassified Streptomyces TaxID=2593676 RepID=UPI003652B3FE